MSTKNVLFIDARVTNYQSIIDGLTEPAEVFILDSASDGLKQMANDLEGRTGIGAIHVISHGSQGALYMGSTVLDGGNLSFYGSELARIGHSLTPTGDILLYGCNVAQGDVGVQFITSLAQYTGADLAASDDATGAAALGGNWEFEKTVGSLETTAHMLSNIHLLGQNTAPTFVMGVGIAITDVSLSNDCAYSVVVQTDGKIVVAGSNGNDFSLVRYNIDGTLDKAFSDDGIVITQIGTDTDVAHSLALQSDGKLLVTGYANMGGTDDIALVRYNVDGTLDTTFGVNGIVTTSTSNSDDHGFSVQVMPNGKIDVIGGTAYSSAGLAVIRYNENGTLDTNFSSHGISTNTPKALYLDQVFAGTMQPDGKVLIASTRWSENGFSITRFNGDGSLDPSFSGDGTAILTTGLIDRNGPGGIALQPDGKVLVTGTRFNGYSSGEFILIRLNIDGTLDTSFSGDGIANTPMLGNTEGRSIVVQANGKILVAGVTNYPDDFAIVRYNEDGTLDTTFAEDGILISSFSNLDNGAYAMALQGDGKILVVGQSFNGANQDVAVARYNANGSLDTTFAIAGSNSLGGTIGYTENAAAIALDSSVAIYDSELAALANGAGNYSGASVTVARHGGASSQDVFSSGGTLTLSGGNAVLSSVTIGTCTNASGTLVITCNSNATQARVDKALSLLNYANISDSPDDSLQIDWTFGDGNSSSQGGGGAMNVTGSTTINITAINDVPTGSVKITGTAAQGQTLTATNTLADLDGLGTFSYQWSAAGVAISGATSNTFILTEAQVGKTITVVASYTDALNTAESKTSSPTTAVANVNDLPTGPVTITGTATQGQTLTASNTLADLDGLGTISYQWSAGGTAINGAAASTFFLTGAQVGKTITVVASYTDGHGTIETLSSNPSLSIANVNDLPTGAVTITGTPTQGQSLTVANTLADLDGIGTISYQWSAGGTAINGAAASTFLLTEAQVGKAITVAASYTDGHGTAETLSSSPSLSIANVNDLPTGSVTITGTATQGQTLTAVNTLADLDGLGTFSYQWSAAGVVISGATSNTFILTAAQVGKTVTGAVSYIDGHGTLETVSSTATATVTAVNISGPVVLKFDPADEAIGMPVGANISVTFNEAIKSGSGSITLKDTSGATVATYDAASSPNLTISENTLTINPSKDLGIFTGYKVEIGAGAIKDLAGNNYAGVSDYNFTNATVDSLYHFFVVAFNAAPGKEYMNQLAQAYNYPLTVKEIVNIFTTKAQFTDTYPVSLSHQELATSLVANIVKNSATAQAKQEAISDIKGALDIGWTVGDMIFTVFGNLANKSLTDPTWGGTAQQFINETAVARYYTEVMGAGGTDLPTLRSVIASVDNHTDVSTPAVIATLIGVELAGVH